MSGDLRIVFFEAEDFFNVGGEVVNVRDRVDNLQETAHSAQMKGVRGAGLEWGRAELSKTAGRPLLRGGML